MNEILFLIHTIVVMAFGFGALRLGKNVLISWVMLQAILANLFVIKEMCFFGFHVTCSDVFVIGGALGLNFLREFYGKESAEKALSSCLYGMLFFILMAAIHLLYTPSSFDTTHPSFLKILSPQPRLLIASLIVFILVQRADLLLFSYLKKSSSIPFAWRNILSVGVTQFLDTLLFSFLGLFGIVESLIDIIMVSFFIKLLTVALMAPSTYFAKLVVKKEALFP